MCKRLIVFAFVAASLYAQDMTSSWIFKNGYQTKTVKWHGIVTIPRLLWLKEGTEKLTFPPDISALRSPSCSYVDMEDKNAIVSLSDVEQGSVVVHGLRGHHVKVDCESVMLKSMDELRKEFPKGFPTEAGMEATEAKHKKP